MFIILIVLLFAGDSIFMLDSYVNVFDGEILGEKGDILVKG